MSTAGHTIPIDSVADAIVARILASRASFSPTLKVVDFDQHWMDRLAQSPDDLISRLPAVFVNFDDGTDFRSDDPEMAIQMGFPFSLNFIYPLLTASRINALPVGRKLAELFVQGEHLDEISELDAALGCRFDEVDITGMGYNRSLSEFNVGWFHVAIKVHVLSQ